MIVLYLFNNLVYALSGLPLVILADQVGLKKMFICGLMIFSLVHFGMAFKNIIYTFFIMFLLYGIKTAASEVYPKFINYIADTKDTATAKGYYTAFQNTSTLTASTFSGLIWQHYGVKFAF